FFDLTERTQRPVFAQVVAVRIDVAIVLGPDAWPGSRTGCGGGLGRRSSSRDFNRDREQLRARDRAGTCMPPGPRLYCFRAARGAGHSTVVVNRDHSATGPDAVATPLRRPVCDPASPPNPYLTVRPDVRL